MPTADWVTLKDEELLKWRLCDLTPRIEETDLQARVVQLDDELRKRDLTFRPEIYLGDEWFSPEGMVAIAMPFYLAHPRLVELEKNQMLEVEGGTPEWCQKLLRHEAGHCFDHAYRFSKRSKWREIFGSPDQEYEPESYRPKPYSRSFVQNLGNWYAQAHPDEDFAETFAVWLDPERDWKKEYRLWPVALAKLEYIDSLAREVRTKEPGGEKGRLPYNALKMKTTLAVYYQKRRREHAQDYPDFFDADLRTIFGGVRTLGKREFGAANFMQKRRKEIIDSVSYWTGAKKFTIEALVKKLAGRCEKLDLRLGLAHEETLIQISAYLTTLVSTYLHTGKFQRRV